MRELVSPRLQKITDYGLKTGTEELHLIIEDDMPAQGDDQLLCQGDIRVYPDIPIIKRISASPNILRPRVIRVMKSES